MTSMAARAMWSSCSRSPQVDADLLPLLDCDLVDVVAGEEARADFRSLGIEEDGDVAALLAGNLAETGQSLAVTVPSISVEKVEPGNVHAGIHQGGQDLFGPARRVDVQTINFSTTTEVRSAEDVVVQFLLDVFEGDVPAGTIL